MEAKASSVGANTVNGPVFNIFNWKIWTRNIIMDYTGPGKCAYKSSFGHQIHQLRQSVFLQNGWNIVMATVIL